MISEQLFERAVPAIRQSEIEMGVPLTFIFPAISAERAEESGVNSYTIIDERSSFRVSNLDF